MRDDHRNARKLPTLSGAKTPSHNDRYSAHHCHRCWSCWDTACFALLLLSRGRRRLLTFAMALASALTALWALMTLLGREDMAPIALVYQANALKDAGWLGVHAGDGRTGGAAFLPLARR